MDGYLTTQLLHVATRLGVPDVLAAGPLTGAEVADAVGAHPGRLTRVLRGLALEDVVEELGDGRFALTATGELLRRDAAVPMGDLALIRGALYHRAAGELLAGILDSVATPFERAYGEPFFALLGRDPALGPAFHAAMANRSEHEAGEVVAALSGADAWRTVVDVGGGSGVLLGALLAAHPQLRGTLLDVPPALPAARERLARLGLAGRAATVAAISSPPSRPAPTATCSRGSCTTGRTRRPGASSPPSATRCGRTAAWSWSRRCCPSARPTCRPRSGWISRCSSCSAPASARRASSGRCSSGPGCGSSASPGPAPRSA